MRRQPMAEAFRVGGAEIGHDGEIEIPIGWHAPVCFCACFLPLSTDKNRLVGPTRQYRQAGRGNNRYLFAIEAGGERSIEQPGRCYRDVVVFSDGLTQPRIERRWC